MKDQFATPPVSERSMRIVWFGLCGVTLALWLLLAALFVP